MGCGQPLKSLAAIADPGCRWRTYFVASVQRVSANQRLDGGAPPRMGAPPATQIGSDIRLGDSPKWDPLPINPLESADVGGEFFICHGHFEYIPFTAHAAHLLHTLCTAKMCSNFSQEQQLQQVHRVFRIFFSQPSFLRSGRFLRLPHLFFSPKVVCSCCSCCLALKSLDFYCTPPATGTTITVAVSIPIPVPRRKAHRISGGIRPFPGK